MQDVEDVNIMLNLAKGVVCFLADDIKGERDSDFKSGEAIAEEHGDNKAKVDSLG